ncbi:phage major capsid protein [Streptomyces sp. NPDC127072]|uniref:phage major capsid protein n=1 Tax=Streptomyces sp. NPDC127072 TaxID=3347129 RepID=UPI003660D328
MSTCDDLYKRQATAALEDRQKVIVELRAVEADNRLSNTEKRERVEKLDRHALQLEAEARVAIERGERAAEVRALASKNPALFTPGNPEARSDEWRALMPSLNEYRAATQGSVPSAGGHTVPDAMAGKYVEILKAKSTFLRALPTENILSFETDNLQVPQLTASSGEDYVAELATIPEGTMTWSSLTFPAKKLGRIQWASSEVLEDSALDLRNIIGQNLLRDASLRFDKDAFTGALTDPIKGIIAQGVTTTLTAGNVVVKYDDLADAVARIEATNSAPSVVWASTDAAAALRKEKSSGSGTYQGGSPTESPASTAWGLPVLTSGHLPSKTVIVADASRLIVGIRRNATIKVSEDARFDSDQVGFKLTMRVAGVSLAEASSVQIVKAAAS